MADVSSVFSTASSIAEKINLQKIGDAMGSGITKLADALKGGAAKATADIKSKFPTNDAAKKPAVPTQQKRPEEVPAIRFAGALTFPAELKYYAKFTFTKYKRVDVFEDKKQLPDVVVVLPLPQNLGENFSVAYDTPALGPIAGQLADTAIAAMRELTQGGQADMANRIKATNDQFNKNSVGQGAYVLARNMITSGNESGIIDKAAGVVPNPHLAAIFSNVGLRSHQFTYKLVPNNAKELAAVKEIIKTLKTRMLPGLLNDSNYLFTFPDTCFIKLMAGDKEVYKVKECVLESLNVNYTPNGPAFFKTGDPVEVTIDMTFKEISVFTREDV